MTWYVVTTETFTSKSIIRLAKALGRSSSVVFEPALAANQHDYNLRERDLEETVEQVSIMYGLRTT